MSTWRIAPSGQVSLLAMTEYTTVGTRAARDRVELVAFRGEVLAFYGLGTTTFWGQAIGADGDFGATRLVGFDRAEAEILDSNADFLRLWAWYARRCAPRAARPARLGGRDRPGAGWCRSGIHRGHGNRLARACPGCTTGPGRHRDGDRGADGGGGLRQRGRGAGRGRGRGRIIAVGAACRTGRIHTDRTCHRYGPDCVRTGSGTGGRSRAHARRHVGPGPGRRGRSWGDAVCPDAAGPPGLAGHAVRYRPDRAAQPGHAQRHAGRGQGHHHRHVATRRGRDRADTATGQLRRNRAGRARHRKGRYPDRARRCHQI